MNAGCAGKTVRSHAIKPERRQGVISATTFTFTSPVPYRC